MKSAAENNLLRCGLSLPCTERSELNLYASIPECFEWLELSGELAPDIANLRNEIPFLQEFEFLNFRNIISASLSSQLTPENQVIVPNYKKQLRELFANIRSCAANQAGIDPDWETLYNDPARLEIFNDILRCTAGDREYYNLTVTIPVRLPGSGQLPIKESLKLLHKLSNYRVNLALDIHPHELLNSQLNWQEILSPFRFDVSCIRLCYVSDLGNKLLFRHIENIILVLHDWKQPLYLAIAPSAQADFEELNDLIKSIQEGSAGYESQQ